MSRFLSMFFYVLFFSLTLIAQIQPPSEDGWVRIRDDKVDFSIAIPSNYVVDREIEKTFALQSQLASLPAVVDIFEKPRITAYQKSLYATVGVFTFRQLGNAQDLLWYFSFASRANVINQDFEVGEFVGRSTTFDSDTKRSIRIVIASKAKIFVIDANARMNDGAIYERLLSSIKLSGNQLLKLSADAKEPNTTLTISALPASPEVSKALTSKEFEPGKRIGECSQSSLQLSKEDRQTSRPLILLRKPHPIPPSNSKKGDVVSVVLRAMFGDDGTISEMCIVAGGEHQFVKAVLKEARKIKFIPAQINSKNVSTVGEVDFGYTIK